VVKHKALDLIPSTIKRKRRKFKFKLGFRMHPLVIRFSESTDGTFSLYICLLRLCPAYNTVRAS
jgi:hypothetical protein